MTPRTRTTLVIVAALIAIGALNASGWLNALGGLSLWKAEKARSLSQELR